MLQKNIKDFLINKIFLSKMAIANKFIHFNTKAGFLNKLSEYVTYDESANTYTVKEGKQTDWNMFKNYTCFIKDTSEIWTHEQFYNAPSTSSPKQLGLNSAIGTSLKYAREDHVHQAPSSISGNAGSASKLLTARTISLSGDVTGSTSFNGSQDVTITATVGDNTHSHSDSTINSLSASKLTGTIDAARLPEIPIEKIPAAALERLFVVASETAAMSASVQEGDVVQVTENNNKMYFCISETATTFANKFKEFTAGTAASVPWSGITNKPSWIGTNKPTYNGSEIKLTGYTTDNINSITANSTVNSAIAELDKYAISSITDESGLNTGNKYVMQSLETGNGTLDLYTNKGVIDTYSDNLVPVDMGNARVIEGSDNIVVYTVDGELQRGPGFTENEEAFLNGAGDFTTPPDTKDYPTSLTWTNGTTAGPIGKLAGTGMSTVNFPAIPSASASNSGVVTTGAQTIAGNKTLSGTTTLNNVTVNNTITANVIKSTNSNSWMTACNYGNGVINFKQPENGGLNSAVVFETNADSHFALSAYQQYVMLGGYKGSERTFGSNTINGHDGGIGIIIDDNSDVVSFETSDLAK